jgi:hypothetical protein
MTTYRLDVLDTAGALRYSITDFTALAYIGRENSPGSLTFAIRGDHPLLADLADFWQFEVWRKPEGQAWYRDFVGIYLADFSWTFGDQSRFVAVCPGILSLLSMREIGYYANYTGRTKFSTTPAESIMKSLVTYNATSAATTANGRKRNGTAWPASRITVQADGAGGNVLDWYCFGENLLKALQRLAPVAGGAFDLVKTAADAYEFRWYAGQRGADRTAEVIFAIERGNMANVAYRGQRDQATVGMGWGRGEEAARDYVTRTGPNYSAEKDIEMFVNGQNVEEGDTAGLSAQVDKALDKAKAVRSFSFQALQSPQTLYGVHYGVGDLVTAVNPATGEAITLKVASVAVTLDQDGNERVAPEFVTP